MKMRINTKQVLNILLIVTWLIFIGVCIEAGGFVVNAFFSLVNPSLVPKLWHEADLSDLLQKNHSYFFVLTFIMSIVAVLRAILFYFIIKILHDNKLNMAQPFNNEMRVFLFRLSFLSLLIGLFSAWGIRYAQWLTTNGVQLPDSQYLRLGGADVWLFMAVILFVIAQIFKKGIEIQSENELTV